MGKIVDFFGALCARRQADEKQTLSHERIEYVRQLVGCELYNRAEGMPVSDVLAALDLIRADVQRHAITGGRIV
jgi:hypothetical protein